MSEEKAIELKGVTKYFGDTAANDHVDLALNKGEILAVLGENGSGKTTLMNMISGIYFPDKGHIYVHGNEVSIGSPKDAFNLGIGMVHQHFKLINVMSALENIVLGIDPPEGGFNLQKIRDEIIRLSEDYGFEIDPDKKIYNMSVSEKQTVEIIKVLYRGADILILDEPTAVLTPQESDKLFNVLRGMKEHGHSIIIITHKLNEVLDISDRVTVLRKGKNAGTALTKDMTVDLLTEMMVGEKITLDIERTSPVNPSKRMVVEDLTVMNGEGIPALKHVTFEARSGEILGVAGISGSGQKELLESIAGLAAPENGNIRFYSDKGEEKDRNDTSIAFVPEDRLGMGLVASMNVTDNVMLRSYNEGKGRFVERKKPFELAKKIIKALSVVIPDMSIRISSLSGGNVQKILLGREISQKPDVLLVAYPTRGLDINSSFTIYNELNEQKKNGVCVICVIEDLDVLLDISDRIIVLSGGRLSGTEDARSSNKERIGRLMTGLEAEK
ncbi:MAG: ABC transporter ATP-binding protein [Lachnospiraceae bacterium]|nr:ABC transporter ATP-binding protein [Lachnospiraceae bacterium]